MRIKAILICIVFLFVWTITIPGVKADVENGWYITGISYDGPIIAQTDTVFYVGVVEAKVKNGEMGELESATAVTDAQVTAVFTKGQEKIEATLIHEQNGEYKGVVALPTAGEWIVKIKAVRGHSEQRQVNPTDQKYEAEFTTPLKAKDPENNWMPVYLFILVFVVAGILMLMWVRKRNP
ncbi:FixH family protein [Brevibacillus agri]|uniref:YtkA-like domain-containing protein n=1 Tax=Brevibacillus gelatini TaxID=1655277 RepID=A0A3M8AZZ3_9BACL|nr:MULTISPECIES: FixH family protein [Brevibacillus]MED4569633.1 FixH family protein [Brevibacillus agri]RNB56620.1 hypothetical protein EDM57_12545 [Brevibacillus gelatini]